MTIKLIPSETKIDFIGKRYLAFVFSALLIVTTILCVSIRGLNYGIDFTGGILMEAQFEEAVDLANMRSLFKKANIDDISLQTFGEDNNILIRVGHVEEDKNKRVESINKIKKIIAENFTGNIDYRKVDYVGPKVGSELIKSGVLSLLIACFAIMLYIWLRFEWQYGVGAILALGHDAILTLGLFSLAGLEFNLTSIAAILTILGYSINDSVVIYDRIRECLRKYKKMEMDELLNLSINQTLSRTVLTAGTTLVAIVALIVWGGPVIRDFSIAIFFGIIIGTYSSIYISAPVLTFMNLRRRQAA